MRCWTYLRTSGTTSTCHHRLSRPSNYKVVFISLECFPANTVAKGWLTYLTNINVVVFNQLLGSLGNEDGGVLDLQSNRKWMWHKSDRLLYCLGYDSFGMTMAMAYIKSKALTIFTAAVGFAMISILCGALWRLGLLTVSFLTLILCKRSGS